MIFAALPKSPDVAFDVTDQPLLNWKIYFPDQRTIAKNPHCHAWTAENQLSLSLNGRAFLIHSQNKLQFNALRREKSTDFVLNNSFEVNFVVNFIV